RPPPVSPTPSPSPPLFRSVEQREQPCEAGRDAGNRRLLRRVKLVEADVGQSDQLAGEDFLQNRRSHADHADTRRHVEAEHPPDQDRKSTRLNSSHGSISYA